MSKEVKNRESFLVHYLLTPVWPKSYVRINFHLAKLLVTQESYITSELFKVT